MTPVESIAEMRQLLAAERAAGRTIALVPTMGALHEGHLALVQRARQLADVVVVSIFVNPLQFGPSEDLDRYPRTLDSDLIALADSAGRSESEAGADSVELSASTVRRDDVLVFAPSVAEMYPDGRTETRVVGGAAASLFEGATRPGHFDGMLTVVAKLLNIAQPQIAVFGQKDAQQVYLVKRMIADLNLPVRLEVVETVREGDGLALSSRNRYLSAEGKRAALVLSTALEAASASAGQGADAARAAARAAVAAEPLAELEYVEIVDPATFLAVSADFRGTATTIIAARVGTTRLIDNRAIDLP